MFRFVYSFVIRSLRCGITDTGLIIPSGGRPELSNVHSLGHGVSPIVVFHASVTTINSAVKFCCPGSFNQQRELIAFHKFDMYDKENTNTDMYHIQINDIFSLL